jgi:hypothetical protein
MSGEHDKPIDKLLLSLQERAKELNCLYEVEQVLNRLDLPLEQAFQTVVEAIPPGWQYPDVCRAAIEYDEMIFTCGGGGDPSHSPWVQSAEIVVQDQVVGKVSVWYIEERPREALGPFLEEEERLIRTIAERLGHCIFYHQLADMRQEWEDASQRLTAEKQHKWRGPIELLRRTDPGLYLRTARKMLNHLCWIGFSGAQELLQETYGRVDLDDAATGWGNYPLRPQTIDQSSLLSGKPFELAASSLGDDEILSLIQNWIMEDKASFLPKVLNSVHSSLAEVADCLRRFHHLVADGSELSPSTLNGLRVSLIRKILTDQLDYIRVAKEYIDPYEFIGLLDRVVLSASSQGKLGGKSAGLFLAEKILKKNFPEARIRVPRSWYIASEGMMRFIEVNDLEEVLKQKYREISQVRDEYPNIVQLIKSSRFPTDIVKGVSVLLDEVGDRPLIVRSSSLLEDRLGSAFAGKYKSLFLANQGSKQERMDALLDAVTEVYGSVFGPDPIAYRRERGLLDFHEEMAILIQEVVGTRIGDYYLPAFSGVGFSRNELRWSPEIRPDDGLLRLVPGLGTRAVDRMSDDYAILLVPGQPHLRVNATIDEMVYYSPKKVDVINLRTSSFETLEIADLLVLSGTDYPAMAKIFSLLSDGALKPVVPLLVDTTRDELIVDFNGLIDSGTIVEQLNTILRTLEESLGRPVDIEFAHDGSDLYLLQCRPQSFSDEDTPAPIPKDVPETDIIFTAGRHVANGWVPDITHIVYVDPDRYAAIDNRNDLLAIGQAVSKLNKLLPKRQFILMGPGRWGSRGDIRIGVSVTYSDINNTAMLIEIARKTGLGLPDLSFGTHFFQDLVESSIRYLPLYPGDEGCTLNRRFLLGAANLLPELLPGYERIADTLRVIDVGKASSGRVLRVLQSSELGEALAMLADAGDERHEPPVRPELQVQQNDRFWRWRMRMAERIAAELDHQRLGVEALYVIGSTKNASAGPGSDIDLLIHFRGSEQQQAELLAWLDGWSLSLGEMNYLRTGHRTHRLLDIHIVTDDDIARGTSFAIKIGAVTDAARPLPLGPAPAPARRVEDE